MHHIIPESRELTEVERADEARRLAKGRLTSAVRWRACPHDRSGWPQSGQAASGGPAHDRPPQYRRP